MIDSGKKRHREVSKKEIGLKIWMLIEDSGYSRDDIANRLKVTLRTVNYWQSGSKLPSIEKLILLAEFLDASLDGLLKN